MIDKYQDKVDDSGVSPVIGVILLVAVTVALVALATVIVFDIGDDVSDSSDATLTVEETATGISVDVIRNENVETLKVTNPNGITTEYDADVGLSESIDAGEGTYTIVAVLEDGTEETIRTITVTDSEILVSGDLDTDSTEGDTIELNEENQAGGVLGVLASDVEEDYVIKYQFTQVEGDFGVLCDSEEPPENQEEFEEECQTEPIDRPIDENGESTVGFLVEGEGNYIIEAQLVDENGNEGDSLTYEFTAVGQE